MTIGNNYVRNDNYSHGSVRMYDERVVLLPLINFSNMGILMSKLRAGGLAMITSANVSENVGKVVELINFLGPSKSEVSGEVAPAWFVKCDTGLVTTEGIRIARAGVFSRRLMPIDGEDLLHSDMHVTELTYG